MLATGQTFASVAKAAAAPVSTPVVAGTISGVYQSLESRLKRVDALYQALLGRGPDPTGWPFWAEVVRSTGDITLAVSLANSEEYWLRAKARY